MDKFLIVGTGRCGTTYCQQVLSAAGLNVTHQKLFTFKTLSAEGPVHQVGDFTIDWDGVDGEVSFMAVPWLDLIKKDNHKLKIIHVYRDQEAVVSSWLRSGMFGEQMGEIHPEFILSWKSNFPIDSTQQSEMRSSSPRKKAEAFYEMWTDECTRIADVSLDINDAYPSQLIQTVGRYDLYADNDGNLTEAAKAMWKVPTDTNKHEDGA